MVDVATALGALVPKRTGLGLSPRMEDATVGEDEPSPLPSQVLDLVVGNLTSGISGFPSKAVSGEGEAVDS